jgi:hypothetical protein
LNGSRHTHSKGDYSNETPTHNQNTHPVGILMKKYIQTREGAISIGKKIAEWDIGEFGFCVEILQTRTPQQNKGIYLYCQWLAQALNDGGYYIQMTFLNKEMQIPFTKENAKERLWDSTMENLTGKTSTTKLERREVSAIYDVLNLFLIEKHNIYVPFPEDKPPLPDVPK